MKFRILLSFYTAVGLTSGAFGANPTWVTVSDPGQGSVFETFSISKFEITAEQYAEFLNAKARSDPHGLYNADMGRVNDPLILRSGSGGSYTYRTVASFAKHPVVWVRGDDARRYCNWLHNGKGSGSTETGAYTMSEGGAPGRNPGALVWLPDFFEWSKAAFFSPVKPGGSGFYNYATQNDSRPASVKPSTTLTNAANHYWDDSLINGINAGYALTNSPIGLPGRYTAPVGSYPASRSYYGTLDQSGNVSELIEGSITAHIGGSYSDRGLDQLIRSHGVRVWINDAETRETGFRIAAVAPLTADTQPVSLIVGTGSPASFSASVVGVGATMQWRKGSADIVGAKFTGPFSSLDFASVKLSDAATYSVRSTNVVGSVTSAPADLVVVDATTEIKHVHKEGQTATMTAAAAGKVTGYLWKRNGAEITGDLLSRCSGVTGKKLTIRRMIAADAGIFTCEVSNSAGMIPSAPQTLFIVDQVPEITPGQTLDDGMVGGGYTPKFITVLPGDNQVPATFSAKGLPAGMKINPATGEIYGTPTAPRSVATDYSVQITARNPIGPSATVTIILRVEPIPEGAVGKFAGVIARDAILNENLGGRLEITSTLAGAYSGKVVLGGKSYSFRGGRLNMNPGVNDPKVIEVKRSKLSSLFLTWNVDPLTNLISGTLADTELVPNEAQIIGWRNKWNARTAVPQEYLGYYTLRLKPDTVDVNIPAGDGFGAFTVSKAGTLRVAGRLPDNTAYTVSTFIGPTGQIAVFQSLYKNQGSILSSLTTPVSITSAGVDPNYVDSSVAGTIHWLKKQQPASVKNYPNPFQDNFTVTGLKYNPVAAGTNALGGDVTTAAYAYLFTDGGDLVGASRTPNASFALSAAHKATVPLEPVNFAKTSLSLRPKTGLFTGRFTLVDLVSGRNVTRTVTYQGVVIRDSAGVGVGYGYFMLGQLPAPTTSLLSGAVRIGVP